MLRLLSVDFYKILRAKFFYITLAILLGLAILSVATNTSIIVKAADSPQGFLDAKELAEFGRGLFWSHIYSSLSLLSTFVSILAILFFNTEFSYGTIKNIATKGYRREEIYLSKFFISVLCALFYFALTVVVSFAATLFAGGTKIPNYYETGKNLYLGFCFVVLFLVVYVAIALMLSSLVRKSGSAMAIFIVFDTVILSILPSMMTLFIKEHLKKDVDIMSYLHSGCFRDSLMLLGRGSENTTSAVIARLLCVAAVFLAVSLGIGIYNFKEKDI